MNEPNDEKLVEFLRRAIPPVAILELKGDLWPQMLRRLDERSTRMPWFDWALVALVVLSFFFFPEAIPGLLYHL